MATALRETQAEARAAPGPRRRAGKLVTVEGIDGSGKSTLAAALHARARERGLDAVLTREPTETWLGHAVKRAIREATDPFSEAFLFLADHAEHVRRIEQWLAQGRLVVSDRYGDSFLAYQAASLEPMLKPRGLQAIAWLTAAQEPVHLAPDMCLLLDLAPRDALHRIADRAEHVKFEDAAFLERVRANYLHLAQRRTSYEVLDARMPGDKLLGAAWEALARRGVVPA